MTLTAPGMLVTPAMLDSLPTPVRRYLDWSRVEGQLIPTSFSLRQQGRLRSANDKPWMPFTAEEDFITGPPGFSWRATVRFAGLPLVRAWDGYVSGQGRMQVRLARVFTMADLTGGAMNQASLLRYLNEMTWFPAAFLLGNVEWQAIDDQSARVSITDCGLTVSATMSFGADGRPVEFAATRHRHRGQGRFTLEPWVTPFTDYGVVNDVRVPTAGCAEYRPASGAVKYLELRLVP